MRRGKRQWDKEDSGDSGACCCSSLQVELLFQLKCVCERKKREREKDRQWAKDGLPKSNASVNLPLSAEASAVLLLSLLMHIASEEKNRRGEEKREEKRDEQR